MPSRVELVAHGRDNQQIAEAIGADLVIFQTLPDLISSVRQFNENLTHFDCSVFTGEYVTGGVDETYLLHLEKLRADNEKGRAQTGSLGAQEGKGGGGLVNGDQAAQESHEAAVGCSGPLSGAEDTIGLYNHRR
jgi:amidophosphoribosyltransferase